MLPLFPLQIVVFPGEDINLHIFEPRYRQLVKDCMSNGEPFGIPPFINDEIMDVGTNMTVKVIDKEYDDGRMDIKCQSDGLFEVTEYFNPYPGKKYAGAETKKYSYNTEGDLSLSKEIVDKMRKAFDLLGVDRKIKPPELFNTFQVGHYLGFSLDQEYHLLTIPEEYDRQIVVLDQLDKILPNIKEMQSIKRKAKLNGEFQNIQPPEI